MRQRAQPRRPVDVRAVVVAVTKLSLAGVQPDPHAKRLTLRVNGDVRQSATTGDMIFRIDAIVEALSRGMTLEPGDIIATGTPEGVGLGRTPPEYLKDGDVMEAEIESIGTLRNALVAV